MILHLKLICIQSTRGSTWRKVNWIYREIGSHYYVCGDWDIHSMRGSRFICTLCIIIWCCAHYYCHRFLELQWLHWVIVLHCDVITLSKIWSVSTDFLVSNVSNVLLHIYIGCHSYMLHLHDPFVNISTHMRDHVFLYKSTHIFILVCN